MGDGHAVGVAAQVVQDGVGSDDGALGEDDPAASAHLAQQGCEGAGVLEGLSVSMELELAGGVKVERTQTWFLESWLGFTCRPLRQEGKGVWFQQVC